MEHKTHTDTDSYTPKCKELTTKKKKKHDLDKKYNMGKKNLFFTLTQILSVCKSGV